MLTLDFCLDLRDRLSRVDAIRPAMVMEGASIEHIRFGTGVYALRQTAIKTVN